MRVSIHDPINFTNSHLRLVSICFYFNLCSPVVVCVYHLLLMADRFSFMSWFCFVDFHFPLAEPHLCQIEVVLSVSRCNCKICVWEAIMAVKNAELCSKSLSHKEDIGRIQAYCPEELLHLLRTMMFALLFCLTMKCLCQVWF